MSATNSTTNYALPIFIGTDKPAWLVDWNGAMTAIDAAIKGVDTDVQGAIVDISGLSSTVASHTSTLSTISGQITVITTNLNTATGNINTINSLIGNGTPTTTDQTLIGAINELHANQGDLDDLTTPAVSLVAAINAISAGGAVAANAVSYDNTASGLTATNVQAAIDEVQAEINALPSGASVLAEVTADGVKNVGTLLNELYALIPNDITVDVLAKSILVTPNAKLTFKDVTASNISYHDFYVSISSDIARLDSIVLQAANSAWRYATLAISGNTFSNESSVLTSGQKLQILVIN